MFLNQIGMANVNAFSAQVQFLIKINLHALVTKTSILPPKAAVPALRAYLTAVNVILLVN
jgi:hypothetical protein